MTNRLVFAIVYEFDELYSISNISNIYNVSSNTVLRILNCLSVSRDRLSEVICIDEFKEDSENIKYQTSLLDGSNYSIIDILPSRDKNTLYKYLKKIPKNKKMKLSSFLCKLYV